MLDRLKSLLGLGAGSSAAAPADDRHGEVVEHEGYHIQAMPYPAKGGFQTAGVIVDPETGREHRFVRAETHPTKDEAAAFAVAKAKQIIRERGKRLFEA